MRWTASRRCARRATASLTVGCYDLRMIENAIIGFDRALRTLTGLATSSRAVPGHDLPETKLSEPERRVSAGAHARQSHRRSVRPGALRSAGAGRPRPLHCRALRKRRARGGGPPCLDAGAACRARRPAIAPQSRVVCGLVCHRRTRGPRRRSGQPRLRRRDRAAGRGAPHHAPRSPAPAATPRAARSSMRCARTRRATARWPTRQARADCLRPCRRSCARPPT